MSNQTGEEAGILKLLVSSISLIVVVVNAIIIAGAAALWRSFKSFKSDIRSSLRDFYSAHEKKHEEVSADIETLYSRERETRSLSDKTKQKIDDHVQHCKENREHCLDRRR